MEAERVCQTACASACASGCPSAQLSQSPAYLGPILFIFRPILRGILHSLLDSQFYPFNCTQFDSTQTKRAISVICLTEAHDGSQSFRVEYLRYRLLDLSDGKSESASCCNLKETAFLGTWRDLAATVPIEAEHGRIAVIGYIRQAPMLPTLWFGYSNPDSQDIIISSTT